MADRWHYKHAGAVQGPATIQKLEQLAAIGEVLATDPVWPEGGDPRTAIDALDILNVECFGKVMAEVDQALAAKPQPRPAAPDWVAGISPEAAQGEPPPTVEPVAEAPDWLADVDTGPAKPIGALPTAPKKTAASPKVAKAHPVSKPKKPAKVRAVAEPLEIEVVEDADAPPGFELRMRDFLVFGLGALTVAVAVGLGVFLANRAFSKREPIEPEPQPQIQAPPHQSPPQVQPQPEPQPQVEPQPEPPPPPAPKNDPDDAK